MYENISLPDLNELYQHQTFYFQKKSEDILIEKYPFEHFELDKIFADDFYMYLKWLMPNAESMKSLRELNLVSQLYSPERYALLIKTERQSYTFLHKAIKNKSILHQFIKLHKWMADSFFPIIAHKFNVPMSYITHDEFLYVIDKTRYKFGPHTDSHTKVISLLFYMPDTAEFPERGTHLLIPKNKEFKDSKNLGGYGMDLFDIYKTTKFIPNNMLAFKRSDQSFHSVSELLDTTERKLLMYTASHIDTK